MSVAVLMVVHRVLGKKSQVFGVFKRTSLANDGFVLDVTPQTRFICCSGNIKDWI